MAVPSAENLQNPIPAAAAYTQQQNPSSENPNQTYTADVNTKQGIGDDQRYGQGPPSVEEVFGTSKPFNIPGVQHGSYASGTSNNNPNGSANQGGSSDSIHTGDQEAASNEGMAEQSFVNSSAGSNKLSYRDSMLYGSNNRVSNEVPFVSKSGQQVQDAAANHNKEFGFSFPADCTHGAGQANKKDMQTYAHQQGFLYWDKAGSGTSKATNGSTYDPNLAQNEEPRKVNFRLMQNVSNEANFDVVIPKESVELVQDRYKHVLYGYFLGNRLAYPVVEYFVKNAWSKYGFKRIMMNSNGFFFFKFNSAEGMENVIRDGPWLIRNNPIFLNIWSPSVALKKEDMGKISVWVKLHDVPLVAYTEDGLSLLASKIGTPRMLDRYTSDMCLDSWGRSSYARAIIEVSAEHELKDSISVAIPHLDGVGFSKGMVRVEYEWRPPRCSNCCVFGHTLESCPKCVKISDSNAPQCQTNNDGYTEVKGKNTKKHRPQVSKLKPRVEYRPVQKQKVVPSKSSQSNTHKNKSVSSSNPFMNLKGYDSNGVPIDDFEDEGLEELRMEKDPGLHSSSGASTPVGATSYG